MYTLVYTTSPGTPSMPPAPLMTSAPLADMSRYRGSSEGCRTNS